MALSRDTIRIPNLPQGKITDNSGNPTDDELTFRQSLITNLQRFMGNEGTVSATQSYANMILIQNHTLENGQYSCEFGTCLYVPDFPVGGPPVATPSIVFCIDSGGGVPLFKRVTLI